MLPEGFRWAPRWQYADGANAVFCGTMFAALSLYSDVSQTRMTGRFKSADFSYTPPSGFSAWGA